jgi:hypothetical protein
MKTKPRFLSIFSGLILVLAGFLLGLSAATIKPADIRPTDIVGSLSKERYASIMIDTGRDILGFQKLAIEPRDTVFSLLTRLDAAQKSVTVASKNYKDLGVMIESINDFKNGASGRYWQYWVNNQYASVAADKYLVKPGDVIMWKFTSSQFKEY